MTNTTKYDPAMPLVGYDNSLHQSAAEARVSFHLASYGITRCDDYYPEDFHDTDAMRYKARSDFEYAPLGLRIEFKDTSRLNGLKTIANADKALHRFQVAEAGGYINASNRQKKMLDSAWSESVHKLSGVVRQLTPARVILVRSTDPDATEHRRLTRHGIFYRTLQNFSGFALFMRMASYGLDVGFYTDDFNFGVAVA